VFQEGHYNIDRKPRTFLDMVDFDAACFGDKEPAVYSVVWVRGEVHFSQLYAWWIQEKTYKNAIFTTNLQPTKHGM